MERRTFLTALLGGLAATALTPKLAEAASPVPAPSVPADLPETLEVVAEDKAALDEADKSYSQLYVRRRVYRRRVVYRRPIRRVAYRGPARRVVYVRPARRVYYRRPVRVIRYF